MTQDMMTLRALLEKSSDADLLRESLGQLQRLGRHSACSVGGSSQPGMRRASFTSDP